MVMKMIKSIIFDCYGTLISTGNDSIMATDQILKSNNSNIDAKEFYGRWKKMHSEICAADSFKLESVVFKRGLENLYKIYKIEGNPEQDVKLMLNTLGRRELFSEVHEVINELSNHYDLAIGSNVTTVLYRGLISK
jgi:FMN phosphatase YigB (HAD superfamily)